MPDLMTMATMKAAQQIVVTAQPAIRHGREAAQAAREIGRILPDAVAQTLCEREPDAPHVRVATELLIRRLQLQELPRERPRNRLRARLHRARGHVPLLRNRVPSALAYGHASFADLMSGWFATALHDPEAHAAVRRVTCAGASYDEQELARRFPSAFFIQLKAAPASAWRAALLDSLRQAGAREEWLLEQDERHRQALAGGSAVVVGAGGGAAALVATEAISAGAGVAVAAAAGVAALIGGGAASVARRRRSDRELQAAVRRSVGHWIDELAAELIERLPPAPSGDPLDAIEQAWLLCERVEVPDPLCDELAGRLRQGACDAGDQELATALYELHDALVRAGRNVDVGADAGRALARLVAAQERPVAAGADRS